MVAKRSSKSKSMSVRRKSSSKRSSVKRRSSSKRSSVKRRSSSKRSSVKRSSVKRSSMKKRMSKKKKAALAFGAAGGLAALIAGRELYKREKAAKAGNGVAPSAKAKSFFDSIRARFSKPQYGPANKPEGYVE